MELYRIYLKHMKYLFLSFLIIFIVNCRSTNDLFYEAVQSYHFQNIVKYTKKGANVNISVNGETALMKAAAWSRISIVKLLINHGADINATDCLNNSALVYASEHCLRDKRGDTDPLGTIKVLIECGADINLFRKDENGRGSSAFFYTAVCLDTSILSLFLDRDADINQQDIHGITPLMHVFQFGRRWSSGSSEGFKYLLKHGADVNLKDDDGKTAFMYAAERGADDEYIQLLLDKGSDINSQDNEGKTAIMLSLINTVSNDSCLDRYYERMTENQFIDVAKILLLNNADFYIKDNSGKNLFDYLEYRKLPLVKEHLSKAIIKYNDPGTISGTPDF